MILNKENPRAFQDTRTNKKLPEVYQTQISIQKLLSFQQNNNNQLAKTNVQNI